MNKKTVLHVCNYSAPYTGNFIASLKSLSQYEQVDNIFLFPYRANTSGAKVWIDELNKEGICAYIQKKSFLKTFFLIKKIIKTHHIEKIITHFSDMKIDCLLKLLVKGKNIIRFFHCTYCAPKNFRHYIRCFLWDGNIMVGVSNFVASRLREIFPKQQVHAVVNAIDFDRLNHSNPFEKKGNCVATIMGWDQKGKGLDLALKAIDQLQDKYSIILQVVAATNGETIKSYVMETLGKDVDWVVVLPPENLIATYLNSSDIFLSPSRAEAFGYSVVEAAYCGNSIVASKVGGQAELEIEGIRWFEPEDIDGLRNQIEESILELRDSRLTDRRARVKKEVQEKYSLKSWSKNVVELLEQRN